MLSLRNSSALLLALPLVVVFGAMGCSGNDDGPAGPAVDTTAPAVPTGVTGTVVVDGATSVRVSWDANETDADLAGYCVYRSHTPDGAYLPVDGDGLVLTNAWVDTAVERGGTYYYRVAARDGEANESALSDFAGVTINVDTGVEPPRVSD